MAFCKSGDAQIHYLLEGPPGAQVLVFSNSLGTNFSMWDMQAMEFQKKLRVLRYDTRGHGKTSVTPGPYSIEQLGKDVLALLDELHSDRVYFCGLSMGGMIGMWLGANAPHRLHKLVLSNTAAKIGTLEGWNARIEAVRKGGMKSVAPAVIERWFTPAFREKVPAPVTAIRKSLEETSREGYVACCAAVRDFDFREQLASIRAPALVLTGKYDPATTPADARFLAERIRGASYGELNAAHISNVEDKTQFNAVVSGFLNP